jgi:ADP-L-glycero-D-manno-heptose 6-epimerase
MKVLVTGHRGFIGQNMVRYLTARGHEVESYEYDPNKTLPRVSGLDAVIHLGAISSTTEKDVNKILEQNLLFSIDLLSMCDALGVKFQYASSASVYGPGPDFNESAAGQPRSPYAWSKYAFDQYVKAGNWKVPVQGFRYFNVYGDHEDHKGDQASPVTKFREQARETGTIKVFKDSDKYYRDFVCVDDVCRVHEKFLTIDQSGIWNVGTGSPRNFLQVAVTTAIKENSKIAEIEMPEELKSQYQRYTKADLTRLNEVCPMEWIDVLDWIRDH